MADVEIYTDKGVCYNGKNVFGIKVDNKYELRVKNENLFPENSPHYLHLFINHSIFAKIYYWYIN